MLHFLVWWLAVSLLAAAAFPLAFRVLHCLPDRGYAAAKPLGLLLTSYLFWIGGSTGLLSNDRGSILFVVLGLLLAGFALGAGRRRELGAFVHDHWRYILTVEVLFLAIFAWFTLLRAYAPNIQATEKPFELALLNGVSRSPFFPPADTWYSGFDMNYYYFGFVNIDVLGKLTGTGNGIGFNLGTPLTAALAAVTLFGLVFGLVRRSGEDRARRASIFAFAAVFLLLFVSSLEGALELAAVHGIGSDAFYKAVGVLGLEAGKTSKSWYPDEYWWWWHATRMGSGWNIMEFPYFSFMLADLHPHVMVIPFALLALTFIWSVFATTGPLDGGWPRRNPLVAAVLCIALGALASLNAWDQPTLLAVLALLTLFANLRRLGAWSGRVLSDSLRFIIPLGALSFLLYLPFWGVELFHKPDFVGIAPTLVSTLPENDLRGAMATPPQHLLLFWGALLWLSLAFLVVHLRRTGGFSLPSRYLTWPLTVACLPLVAWVLAVTYRQGIAGLGRELSARGGNLLTVLMLTVLVVLALAALLREALPEGRPVSEPPVLFALVLVTAGLLFLFGAELFYVVESALPPVRANTVFKFWYQAWILQSAGDAVGLAYILRVSALPRRLPAPPLRLVWLGATALVLLLALIYPLTATLGRTNGFTGPRSLDGLAYWQGFDPADFAAAAWLAAHADGMPVVLEAEGPPNAGTYSVAGGRISELSGLPTILAWSDHERQFRNNLAQVDGRSAAIRTIYTTPDVATAARLLGRYGVRYVVVGALERQAYGDAGLAKFALMAPAVYRAPSITIYDLAAPLASHLFPIAGVSELS